MCFFCFLWWVFFGCFSVWIELDWVSWATAIGSDGTWATDVGMVIGEVMMLGIVGADSWASPALLPPLPLLCLLFSASLCAFNLVSCLMAPSISSLLLAIFSFPSLHAEQVLLLSMTMFLNAFSAAALALAEATDDSLALVWAAFISSLILVLWFSASSNCFLIT